MKKKATFKTPNMFTRAEETRFSTVIADLDYDFNIKVNDSTCPFMIRVSGKNDFHISELDYISSKLKENRAALMNCITTKGSASILLKTGDNVYNVIINK